MILNCTQLTILLGVQRRLISVSLLSQDPIQRAPKQEVTPVARTRMYPFPVAMPIK